jgi:hypothetical protein
VCFPAGTLGHPIGQCESALCLTDADCVELPDGRCMPVEDGCYGKLVLLACVYPDGGCRTTADCSSDTPPFEVGETYCDSGSCAKVLAGTFCTP